MESEWAGIVAARQERALTLPETADEIPWKLRRIEPSTWTPASCKKLVKESVPFVVEQGIEFCPVPANESMFDFLRRVVGPRKVPVEMNNQPHDIMTIEDLLNAIGRGELLYMYDVPIARRLNALLDNWRVPRFFCEPDYLKKTRLPHAFTNWPTLFIGAKGTQSSTHLDRWHGDFYMLMLEGVKRWTIWPEYEIRLLKPDWSSGKFDPLFPPIQSLRGSGSPIEVLLHPGELLFVPGGTPHAVENLSNVVAMAGNFVTGSNLGKVLEDLKCTSVKYADDRALYEALSEIDFDDDDQSILSCSDPIMDLYE